MAGNDSSLVRPKTPQNPDKILAGSPLAIQGIFLEIIRERFSKNAGLDWIYDEDITRTAIIIETSFNEETESRSATPGVFISRLQSTPSKVQVGDRTGVRLPDHLEAFGAIMDVGLGIECVANDAGESSIIADIVQFMILGSSDVIQREFGFLNIEHPVMGQTQPFAGTQGKWTTPINFSVSFWVRWSQAPIAPVLQQITQRITQKDTPTYFIESVINSMRRNKE